MGGRVRFLPRSRKVTVTRYFAVWQVLCCDAMALGAHKIEFEALEGWDRLPDGYAYVEVAGVACDSRDRVYVFNRGAYPVIVFDKDGQFLNAWGKGVFKNPHGIFIDHEDYLWLADDKDHTVHKFTADGERLMTI